MEKQNIIDAKKVTQNNQEFLIGIFRYEQVRDFTRYTKRLIIGFTDVEEEDQVFEDQRQIAPQYNPEIQRKTNNSKVEGIAEFLINDSSAMFPTNIVIGIPQVVIDSKTEDEHGNTKIILNPIVKEELRKKDGDVFLTIIDGQHRIKGIERAIEKLKTLISNLNDNNENVTNVSESQRLTKILNRLYKLELIVTFFIDPTLEYQAMIFSTINKTQTKVPENLVFSLFGLTKDDTPQKTSLEVVLALNGIEKSPFFNRIKLVGGNYNRGDLIPLSQATMVKSILFRICKNQREAEIERNKTREQLNNNLSNLPFRSYYANNNDRMIIRILYSFFSAVRDTFVDANDETYYWNLDSTENLNVLQTNVAYQALIKILIDLLKIIPEDKKDDKKTYSEYLEKVSRINWKDDGLEKRYPFTSKSINVLYNDLKDEIFS
ncbi:DGQHR domain-containing protein [Flavobacterium plurextorum]|uniref:DGQHR domain-containing protein n=1 Tax=Flavobacterium plurextorum TaxID=1114867 RepID=UPI003756A1E3